MTPSIWFWNSQLAPNASDYFSLEVWRKMTGTTRYTVGGLVLRLIQFTAEPLLFFVSRDRVIATVTSESLRVLVHAELVSLVADPSKDYPAIIVPGEKNLGVYPVTCPGYSHSSTLVGPNGLVPSGDVRAAVLGGRAPNYTASSLINLLGDNVPVWDSNWLVSLDQITAEVCYFHSETSTLSNFVPGIITDAGMQILIAFERTGL